MEISRVMFLGYAIDNLSLAETIALVDTAIETNRHIVREDLNAAKVVWMERDQLMRQTVSRADIINADGQAILWAARILGTPIKERVTGIDLMESLVRLAHKKGYTIFLLGAEESVVRQVVTRLSKTYSPDIIAGYKNGYYLESEEASIANQIRASRAHIVFVGMNSPKKEYFIDKYRTVMDANLVMGVGGGFDVISGKIPRAPRWIGRAGFEWAFRLSQEPRRLWKRYLYTIPRFIWIVIKERLRQPR